MNYSPDPVTHYLRDVDRTSCISHEDAVATVAQRPVRPRGESMRPLTPPEQKMVNANLRLVLRAAVMLRRDEVIPFADLLQEGNIGLMVAVQTWRPSLGRFSTHAWYSIRGHMLRARTEAAAGMFSIPTGIAEDLRSLRKARARLLHEFDGRGASAQELAEESGIDKARVDRLLCIPHVMSTERQHSFRAATRFDEGMASEVGGTENNRTENLLMDSSLGQDERMVLLELMHATRQVLATLSPREELVLRLRYGLSDKEEMTLEEVGMALEVTRERIRQIEHKALRKLRHYSRSKRLRPFIDD